MTVKIFTPDSSPEELAELHLQIQGIAEQSYIQHYRTKDCDPTIVNNTEGIFNFCLYLLSEVDRLTYEVEKKTINIARLKEIIFGNSETALRDPLYVFAVSDCLTATMTDEIVGFINYLNTLDAHTPEIILFIC